MSTENYVPNFLEDEDYESTPQPKRATPPRATQPAPIAVRGSQSTPPQRAAEAPVGSASATTESNETTAESSIPTAVKPSVDSAPATAKSQISEQKASEKTPEKTAKSAPKKRRYSVSRAWITPGNAHLLAFIAMFPGADSSAISLVLPRQDEAAKGRLVLPTVRGTEQRLAKLEKLGALTHYKHPITKINHYSITDLGIDAIWTYGYDIKYPRSLHRISNTRVNHYRQIALVAAKFASPVGFFREDLGSEPVGLEGLYSENEMRGHYENVKKRLKEAGGPQDFGREREELLKRSLADIQSGDLAWSELVEARPELLTLGSPKREGMKGKPVYQPDLAVISDAERTSADTQNLLVEIELSRKSEEDYEAILWSIEKEVNRGVIYDRAVYFTVGAAIGNRIKKVDRGTQEKPGPGLIKQGKLLVLPLTKIDGTPVVAQNRILLGGRK